MDKFVIKKPKLNASILDCDKVIAYANFVLPLRRQ